MAKDILSVDYIIRNEYGLRKVCGRLYFGFSRFVTITLNHTVFEKVFLFFYIKQSKAEYIEKIHRGCR